MFPYVFFVFVAVIFSPIKINVLKVVWYALICVSSLFMFLYY